MKTNRQIAPQTDCSTERGARRASSRGMVLASILILLGLIVGITVSYQVATRLSLRHAQRRLLRAQLRAAAIDAAWNSLLALSENASLVVNHTNEAWASPIRTALPNGINTESSINDEQRLFDLNNLSAPFISETARQPVEIAARLFEGAGCKDPVALAQSLVAWFAEDEAAELKPGRPASDKKPDPNSPAAGKLLESPAELLRVLVIDNHKILELASALPSARTRPVPVNVNSVKPAVLSAVLGSRGAAEAICLMRDGEPILTLTQLSGLLGPDGMRACNSYLDVKSSFFSVTATAERDGQKVEVFGLAHRDDDGQIGILRWTMK